MNQVECEILIVEDNVGDSTLLREAFDQAAAQARLRFTKDGSDALRYLERKQDEGDMRMPSLIVLDLKMPRMNGFDLMKVLKATTALRTIPVVVLTGSDAEMDKEMAFSLGAHSYFTKPTRINDWLRLAVTLDCMARRGDT